jgi:hypothetical protein
VVCGGRIREAGLSMHGVNGVMRDRLEFLSQGGGNLGDDELELYSTSIKLGASATYLSARLGDRKFGNPRDAHPC